MDNFELFTELFGADRLDSHFKVTAKALFDKPEVRSLIVRKEVTLMPGGLVKNSGQLHLKERRSVYFPVNPNDNVKDGSTTAEVVNLKWKPKENKHRLRKGELPYREARDQFLRFVAENRAQLYRQRVLNKAHELRAVYKNLEKEMIGRDNLLKGESGRHKRDHTRGFLPNPTLVRMHTSSGGRWRRDENGEDHYDEEKSVYSEFEEEDFAVTEFEEILADIEEDEGEDVFSRGTGTRDDRVNFMREAMARSTAKAGRKFYLKGGSNIGHKSWRGVVESGQGGRSKVPRPPRARPEDVAKAKEWLRKVEGRRFEEPAPSNDDASGVGEAMKRFNRVNMVGEVREKFAWENRLGAEPPGRTLFDGPSIEPATTLYDISASPYCLMASIDHAVGVEPSYDYYVERYSVEKFVAEERGEQDISVPNLVGNEFYAEAYAKYRGVNLIIHDVNGVLLHEFEHNPMFKWVHLVYLIPTEGQVGHFVMRMSLEFRDNKSGSRNERGVTRCSLFNSFLKREKVSTNFPEFGPWTQGELPNQGALHDSPFLNPKSSVYDGHMSPFCGIGHISMATGRKLTFEDAVNVYFSEAIARGAPMVDNCPMPSAVVGDVEFLARYALEIGVNLSIYTDTPRLYVHTHSYEHCKTFQWVQLLYTPLGGNRGHFSLITTGDSGGQTIGHCDVRYRGVYVRGWCHTVGLVYLLFGILYGVPLLCDRIWFMAFVLMQFVSIQRAWILGERFVEPNTNDRRTVIDRRDDLQTQDSYRKVMYTLALNSVFGKTFLFTIPSWASWMSYTDVILVSEVRFLSSYVEMQHLSGTGRDYRLALAGIGGLREVNTNASLENIILNTIRFAGDVGSQMTMTGGGCNTQGLVAVNEPGVFSGGMRFKSIASNQTNARIFGGQKLLPEHMRQSVNHVVNYRLEKGKSNVPIAIAPIGALEVGGGKKSWSRESSVNGQPFSVGWFHETDEC